MYVYMHMAYIHIYICMYECVYCFNSYVVVVYMFSNIVIYQYVHVYICIYAYGIYTYIYTYICLYEYVCCFSSNVLIVLSLYMFNIIK